MRRSYVAWSVVGILVATAYVIWIVSAIQTVSSVARRSPGLIGRGYFWKDRGTLSPRIPSPSVQDGSR